MSVYTWNKSYGGVPPIAYQYQGQNYAVGVWRENTGFVLVWGRHNGQTGYVPLLREFINADMAGEEAQVVANFIDEINAYEIMGPDLTPIADAIYAALTGYRYDYPTVTIVVKEDD